MTNINIFVKLNSAIVYKYMYRVSLLYYDKYGEFT